MALRQRRNAAGRDHTPNLHPVTNNRAGPPRAFYAVGFIILGVATSMLVLSLDDGSHLAAIATGLFAAIGCFGMRLWLRRTGAQR